MTGRHGEKTGLEVALGRPAADVPEHDDAFVASVMRRLDGAEPAPRWAFGRLALASGGLAAALLAVVALTLFQSAPLSTDGTFRARGGAAKAPLHALAGCEVSLVEGKHRQPAREGAILGQAALAFEVTNATKEPLYLLAFAIDAANEVHWFYPAYTRAADNPMALKMAAGTRKRTLPQLVRPGDPALGALRIVTVLSLQPRRVKEVEALLAQHHGDARKIFANDNLRMTTLKVSPR